MSEKKKFVSYANGPSLEEINATVEVPENGSFFKKLLAYSGPGALVAVGYMDPGNWVTSIAGGAQFKYKLLSVVLISSLVAMLLQYMASKVGIVTSRDLAQLTRDHTNKSGGFVLWIVAELAIMATDIAEIIGSAIAIKLLFHVPLLVGVLITAADVLLLLLLMKLGFRKIEALVAMLITVILGVFLYEVLLAEPNFGEMMSGYIPSIEITQNQSMLYIALGIVGATVMPHNLYLHSSISQARKYDREDEDSVKDAVRFSTWDSNIQLTLAFVVNSLLLTLGAALFYGTKTDLGRLGDLFNALQDPAVAGSIASPTLAILFAIALLASGQNSTITGTLSGQIVMEGFVHMKIPLWARRVITRLLSISPVIFFTIYYHGNEAKIESLLTFSQVFLSVALPFSIFPLVYFSSNKKLMGNFANKPWIKWLGYFIAVVLTILNIWLIITSF
ncbi:Nramp family divalent metal transporter [Lactobacillus sp. YT155]|uniref:Nramp family divalent metal transporter n=1 Tax=Lactobacillus sp. YT155 TaxID=3060955 RepID=UPI00265E0662|nr:Nramp family divalent metal transporter [Lactobacillus sp. YT155]MDO1605779.1 Nramp family divalent metal transporter [Lactobacillus sp. YT155]